MIPAFLEPYNFEVAPTLGRKNYVDPATTGLHNEMSKILIFIAAAPCSKKICEVFKEKTWLDLG
jgi:hypothetical protein